MRVNERGLRDRRGRHRVSAEIAPELRDLIAAARAAGHILRIDSAFRSYAAQAQLFATILEPGRAARPGHSEHQLGTAVDVRLPSTAAIGWLAETAPRFGFVVSYPPGKQKVTGYRPEPWHVRYVGRARGRGGRPPAAAAWRSCFAPDPSWANRAAAPAAPSRRRRPAAAAVTGAGVCDGTVLTWCYEGALATVDCAASRQACGPSRRRRATTASTRPDAAAGGRDPHLTAEAAARTPQAETEDGNRDR